MKINNKKWSLRSESANVVNGNKTVGKGNKSLVQARRESTHHRTDRFLLYNRFQVNFNLALVNVWLNSLSLVLNENSKQNLHVHIRHSKYAESIVPHVQQYNRQVVYVYVPEM